MKIEVNLHLKMDKIKVIFNNDVAILDFMADLEDKTAIPDLQKFINHTHGGSGLLLLGCVPDNLNILIMVKDPFGFNEEPNKLVMYASDDIYKLCHYFKNQLDHTSPDTGAIYGALEDITAFLFLRWNIAIKDGDYVKHGRAT